MSIVIGTQFYAGGPDAMRRQTNAAAALVALSDVHPVNVQWRVDPYDCRDIQTAPVLERDSLSIADCEPRRPFLVDIFDALAAQAVARRCRRFLFVNSDIIVTQAAVDAIERLQTKTCALCRMDFDRHTGRDAGVLTSGIDGFAFDVEWWRAERTRFRPYILGSWFYDGVFTAIMMTFGDGRILNRAGEIRHEIHEHTPTPTSPSMIYNGSLAALDAREFSLWARFHAHLEELRAGGASEAEEHALAEEDFVWRPSVGATIWHAGRCARARWRYARMRVALSETPDAGPR
jgi:hypothetical protein